MSAERPEDEIHGHVAQGFEPVLAAFRANFADRGDLGAAFSAVVDGQVVVDLWGGFADDQRTRPWTAETVAGIYSGTKGFVATCLTLLLDRGQLDLDAPVAQYWPEFAAAGKDGIAVRHIVSHASAIPGLVTPITLDEAADGQRIAALLAQQAPLAPPATAFWYHAMTFGWLCGELIRRIDGRSVGTFFAQEIAGPLGLDLWIGLPAEVEPRVATLVPAADFGQQKRNADAAGGRDDIAWSIWANPPRFSERPLPANRPSWHAAEIPATNGIASARSLARLYGCLADGGVVAGIPLASAEAIATARRELTSGYDPYLGTTMRFGVGFQCQVEQRLGPPSDAFGHAGTGGSVHGAWPQLGTGFSYVMNLLRDDEPVDARSASLLEALHAVVSAQRGPAPRSARTT